jgi:integrase
MDLAKVSVSKLKLSAGKSEEIIFDDKLAGFGIRLREGGSRTWIFQYRVGTKQRRMTIGSAASMPAAKARKAAADLDATVHLGGDPAGDKAKARIDASNARTFEMAMDEYLAIQERDLKPRSFLETERNIRVHGKPLHKLEVAKIDLKTIAAELRRITKAGGPVAANRARSTWSAFFNWCAGEGYIETNPVAFTNKNEEETRDRVLGNAELRAIWKALPESDYGDIVRLLALTGQRREEIGGLRWSEIDFDQGIITLPAVRTKNGREHIVPMSAAVRSILEARLQFHGRDLVFGIGGGGFSGWSRCKERLDEKLKIADWILHDLRRTVATKMAGAPLSIQPHVVEAVLNHISGHKAGVAGIYNRETYLPEKKQALALWADHLTAIVEGRSNVVSLRTA